jgi:hypothetical protein
VAPRAAHPSHIPNITQHYPTLPNITWQHKARGGDAAPAVVVGEVPHFPAEREYADGEDVVGLRREQGGGGRRRGGLGVLAVDAQGEVGKGFPVVRTGTGTDTIEQRQ